MENKIKVSVIMPVYNSGEYLQTAVDSILSQSLKDIELILVDDGSTDGSSEKCEEYAKKDKRVVVIHQRNGGICNARNAALKIARGEYIGFSDHDDEYLPGLLEDNYKLCITQNLDFVKFCKKWDVVEDGKVIERHSNTIAQKVFTRDDVVNNLVVLMKIGSVLVYGIPCSREVFFERIISGLILSLKWEEKTMRLTSVV